MQPPLTPHSAMTLLLVAILELYSKVVYTLAPPDLGHVAKNLKVSHFDYGAMTENTLYALIQVQHCHFTPGELENSLTKIIPYTTQF